MSRAQILVVGCGAMGALPCRTVFRLAKGPDFAARLRHSMSTPKETIRS